MKTEAILEAAGEIDKLLDGKPYYNCGKLIRKALCREKPCTIAISTTTRSIGKTSYFVLFNYFLRKQTGCNICYIVRQVNELKNYHMVFADIIEYYHLEVEDLRTKIIVPDTLAAIYDKNGLFSYVACIKKADTLKKYSALFRDTECIVVEEYQLEAGKMVKNEPELLKTMIRSIGRGHGKLVREVFTALLGNTITLLNPYLVYFGIAPKYRGKDEIIIHNRIAAEFSLFNEASKQMAEHSITDIFASSDYDIGKSFLYAADTFVTKIPTKTRYIFTILYGKDAIGIREDLKSTKCYCVPNIDPNCKTVMVFQANEMQENAQMMKRYCYSWKFLEARFNNGKLFFANLKIKQLMFDLLGISVYN